MTPKFPDDDAPAALAFSVPNAKSLTPFEFCNKHGLYVGPTVDMNGDTLETTLLGTIAPILDNQISTTTVTTITGSTTLTTTTILTTTITTSTLTTVTTTRTTMQSVSGFSVSDLDRIFVDSPLPGGAAGNLIFGGIFAVSFCCLCVAGRRYLRSKAPTPRREIAGSHRTPPIDLEGA